jgi:hypothetical protein
MLAAVGGYRQDHFPEEDIFLDKMRLGFPPPKSRRRRRSHM